MANVTITKNGRTHTVTERAFERVWKKRGWKIEKPKAKPASSPTPAQTQSPTPAQTQEQKPQEQKSE